MKLMICGKGGSGKSTVTSLLAKQYLSIGKQVVVIDSDTSNVSLHKSLGLSIPPDLAHFFFSKPSTRESLKALRDSTVSRDTPLLGTWSFATIPDECHVGNGKLKLVRIGKIPDAKTSGKGRWVAIARQFLAGLSIAPNDRLLIDTDAGIEHFTRGLGHTCDQILFVVDPSYESIALAQQVAKIGVSLQKPFSIVLNKVNAETSHSLRAALPSNLNILGEIPNDAGILTTGLVGGELSDNFAAAASLVSILETSFPTNVTV